MTFRKSNLLYGIGKEQKVDRENKKNEQEEWRLSFFLHDKS